MLSDKWKNLALYTFIAAVGVSAIWIGVKYRHKLKFRYLNK